MSLATCKFNRPASAKQAVLILQAPHITILGPFRRRKHIGLLGQKVGEKLLFELISLRFVLPLLTVAIIDMLSPSRERKSTRERFSTRSSCNARIGF